MRQKLMELIGAEGCYFLCLAQAAEKMTRRRIDAVAMYEDFVTRGWMGRDCFLNRPELILGAMTGKKWSVRRDTRIYKPQANEIMILRYERVTINKTWAHFVLCGSDGLVEYDPYGDSMTVRDGKPVSSRVFTLVS
jgi:hypothetical protein